MDFRLRGKDAVEDFILDLKQKFISHFPLLWISACAEKTPWKILYLT